MLIASGFWDDMAAGFAIWMIIVAVAGRGLFKMFSSDGTPEGGMRDAAGALKDAARKQDVAGHVTGFVIRKLFGK